jgi:nucleoside-diphosphate-sugar epimerase
MTDVRKVLITGSAGRIGRAVVRELKSRGWFVRGFDLVPTLGADESLVGTLTDEAAVHRAAEGMRALVHLAATPDDDDFMTKLLPNNLVGVYHVFEAARLAGVRRLVAASSGQVVWWQRFTGPLPIVVDTPPTPRGWYAAAKLFLEGACRVYVEAHGLSVIAARLGWCPRTAEQVEELAATDWGPNVYLSPRDAGRFFACAVEAPDTIRFAVVYACSRPYREAVYDDRSTRELTGYEPLDTWPDGVEEITGKRGDDLRR